MTKVSEFLSLIIKLLLIVGVIAVALVIYQSCAGSPLVQKVQQQPPEANYTITTMTRDYYADKAVENDDGTLTMSGWYVLKGEKWQYNKGSITLPKVLRPQIQGR